MIHSRLKNGTKRNIEMRKAPCPSDRALAASSLNSSWVSGLPEYGILRRFLKSVRLPSTQEPGAGSAIMFIARILRARGSSQAKYRQNSPTTTSTAAGVELGVAALLLSGGDIR